MSDLPRQFGAYNLLKLLARGGMGEIYLARTAGISSFEKYYAVKRLLKKFTHDNDVGARFVDEARLGARLQHPNIVQVYDLGRVNDELYMATEFVDGFDLRRVLRFCHERKKRIPIDIAIFIVREILSGLAYAHRQVDAEGNRINLIHRDISPQNVLVSFEGEVKIIDFGLAKSTQRSQETQANVLLGNFGYMSPEQARGHALDVRTDVYSAGIVLFELVTGTKRFVEENPLRLLEIVARPTPIMPSDRVPGTPRVLDKLYARATAPEREQRYESAEAFRDDVTAALHKINPRATREHLAQFLNHLFLGGQAPPSVDTDALNKSVAMHVQELYASTDAFNRPKTEDVRDRALAEFSDDAPQTGAHEVMRAARVGDVLTHEQLTGEALAQPINVVDEEPEVIPDGTDFITPLPSSLDQPPVAPEGLAVWDEGTALTNPTSVYEGPAWGSGASGSQDGKTASYVALAHSMATVVGGAAGSSEDIIVEPEPTEIRGVSLPPLRAPGPPPVDLPERRLHARMPQEPLGLHDLDTARVKPVPPLEETSQEVFANAGDSMIIEFEHGEPTAQAELQDPSPEKRRRPTPPPMPGDTSAIRPAAQPLGKRVVPAVATARPRPREETSSTTTNTAGGLPVPPVTPRRR